MGNKSKLLEEGVKDFIHEQIEQYKGEQDKKNIIRSMDFLDVIIQKKGYPDDANSKDASELKGYKLERKLKGGILEGMNVYVPEGAIRSMGAENGDYITFKKVRNAQGEERYQFYMEKEMDEGPSMDRIQVNYGVVKRKEYGLVVEESTQKPFDRSIKIEDNIYTIILNDSDINDFGIREGDIVDISFYKNAPEKNRILWKHYDERDFSVTERPYKSGVYKKKNEFKEKEEKEELNFDLKGKTVLIVGLEPRRAVFQDHIEERGGIFISMGGNEDADRLKAAVRKSDIVGLGILLAGHVPIKETISYCKKMDKPFFEISKNGVETMLFSLKRCLEQNGMVESEEARDDCG